MPRRASSATVLCTAWREIASRRASSDMLVGLPPMWASSRLCAGVMYENSLRRTPLMISRANQSERASSSCLRLSGMGGGPGEDGRDLVNPC